MEVVNNKNRSFIVFRQTGFSLLFQFLSVVISFLIVPLSISFFKQDIYGIWITLISGIYLITYFDFGIGMGFRNKLTECLVAKNYVEAREYVSTAYILVGIIVFILLIIGLIGAKAFDWNHIFKYSKISNDEISKAIIYIYITALIIFSFGLVHQILNALHKSSLLILYPIFLNGCLLILFYLRPSFVNKLSSFSFLYMIISLVYFIILNCIIFFRFKYLVPNFNFFNKKKIKAIFGIGTKFFIIQLCILIIYNTDNFIIANLLGPKEVTSYQLTRQVFNVLITISTLYMAPLWSAFTDAYIKNDINWITSKINFLIKFLIPVMIFVMFIIFFGKHIFDFWLHTSVEYKLDLFVYMGIYSVILIWSNIFGCFLNGISKINGQLISSVIAAIINIPLSIYFVKNLNLGNAGVILATIFSISIFAIVGPIQTFAFLKKIKKNLL